MITKVLYKLSVRIYMFALNDLFLLNCNIIIYDGRMLSNSVQLKMSTFCLLRNILQKILINEKNKKKLIKYLRLPRDWPIWKHAAKRTDRALSLVWWQHRMGCFECILRPGCAWRMPDTNPTMDFLVALRQCWHNDDRPIGSMQTYAALLTNVNRSPKFALWPTLTTLLTVLNFVSLFLKHSRKKKTIF